MTHHIRRATQDDAIAVNTLSVETGLSEGDNVSGPLEPMNDDHTWIVLVDDADTVIGGAYYGPEGHSDRVWNLYFLAVSQAHQGGGTGSALIAHVENDLRERGTDVAKLLLIETSSVASFDPTREFYRKHGYLEVARVPEYYGDADDKVVFWKSLMN